MVTSSLSVADPSVTTSIRSQNARRRSAIGRIERRYFVFISTLFKMCILFVVCDKHTQKGTLKHNIYDLINFNYSIFVGEGWGSRGGVSSSPTPSYLVFFRAIERTRVSQKYCMLRRVVLGSCFLASTTIPFGWVP